MIRLAPLAACCLMSVAGCSAAYQQSTAMAAAKSILVQSDPAPGAVVAGPVNALRLRFMPPARLDEVTVAGPEGTMPTMVHAVGEISDYSVPLAGLGAGDYTVNWKASAAGVTHTGSFGFRVK